MKKLMVGLLLVAPLAASADNGFRPIPIPGQPYGCVKKLASACVLDGMKAGAFETMDSEALATYCLDVSKRVCAEYRVHPE